MGSSATSSTGESAAAVTDANVAALVAELLAEPGDGEPSDDDRSASAGMGAKAKATARGGSSSRGGRGSRVKRASGSTEGRDGLLTRERGLGAGGRQ